MRRRILALAALAVVALGGCARENDDREAAASSEPQRAACVVSDPEGEVIVHPGSLTPEADIVLDDVALQDAVNLEIAAKNVVRFTGRSTIQGVIQDYPPLENAGLADSLADWEERQPLPGLALSPTDGQQAVLVALRLVDPEQPGHLDGVTLSYTEDGEGREVAMTQPLLVEPTDALCTIDEVDSTLEWAPQEPR